MSAQKTPMIDVSKLPVDQAVNKLIAYAVMMPASDIFLAAVKTR